MNDLEMQACANLWQQTFQQSLGLCGDAALATRTADDAIDAFRAKVFGQETTKAPNPLKAVP